MWHTNLPIYLSENIEMVEKRAMRAIFPEMGYVDILNHIGVCTLNERRDYLCKMYFTNIQSSAHKVNHLLPEKRQVDYDIRTCNTYLLPLTRTNSFRKFPGFIPLAI